MALTERLVINTYNKIKQKAKNYLNKGKISKGLLYTHLAGYTNYSFWLSYHDDEIENLLIKASKSIFQRNYTADNVVSGRCVMLDSLARYRGGLTVQYVNAIVAAGWKLLYITNQDIKAPHHLELGNFLNSLNGVQILEIPKKLQGKEKLQFVYDSILDYGAERAYLHCTSSDSFFPALCYALPCNMKKYYIDAADHGFRMGMKSCDYAFEFRDLGCSIAAQYRGVPKEKMLNLPFYPILDNLAFKGLPSQCDNKVIILSGGIYWKIIDKEDTFFKLCNEILKNHNNTIILFPGSGDPVYVQNKIKEFGIEDRFLLLGWRNDISELFRRADVFLNTYPHGGGTMSQYAAHTKTPILSFSPLGSCQNPVENFVCQIHQAVVSSVGETDFLREAHELIENKSYRREKAEMVYSCVLGVEKFNQYFKQMSLSGVNILPFDASKNVEILHDRLEKKIKYYNELGEYQMRIVSYMGINSITFRLEFLTPFIKQIYPKLKRVIITRGFHFNRV